MSTDLYLFIPNNYSVLTKLDSLELSWIHKNTSSELKMSKGRLKDAARLTGDAKITVVIPGENITHLLANVPGNNKKRVIQAVPYILEDSLVDDVDNLHFAVNEINKNTGEEIPENQYQVAVVNKKYIESLITELDEANIHADVITADYSLLPANTILFSNAKRVLCNIAGHKFSSEIDLLLNLDISAHEKLKLFHSANDESKDGVNSIINKYQADIIETGDYPQITLTKIIKDSNIINLRQGYLRKRKNWSKTGKAWYPAAAVFLAWLLVQGGVFIENYWYFSQQNSRLNNEITQIYKNTFPEAKRIIDPQAQMRQKLQDLQKKNNQSGYGFSDMLAQSAVAFAQVKDLKIKTLRYYDGRINLDVEVLNLQSLESLKTHLVKNKGFTVDIQSASSGKDNVSARLQIIGSAL